MGAQAGTTWDGHGRPAIVVRDDLHRSRLTTGFRLILALPHIIWLALWGTAMVVLSPVMWIITLVTGRPNEGLREFYENFLRYTLHVNAYLTLAANPFPGFLGLSRDYPVDVEFPPIEPQNRWTVGFRLLLALPAILLVSVLGGWVFVSSGVAAGVSFLAWFAILARGRMPAGFRDLIVWTLGYGVQVAAYVFTVTGRYPDADPRAVPLLPRPRHTVRMVLTDDGRRNRVTVFFRLILAIPHQIWLALWSIAAVFAAFAAWVAGIALGRVPTALHRFLAAYVRYVTHVSAFTYLAAGPFPGFTGAPGSYPVDLDIAPEEAQSRWTIGFRWLLAFPALAVVSTLGYPLLLAAAGAWFWAMARGDMPRGVHRLLAYALRYSAQTYAYALLLTERYPHSGPSEDERDPAEPEPSPEPQAAAVAAAGPPQGGFAAPERPLEVPERPAGGPAEPV